MPRSSPKIRCHFRRETALRGRNAIEEFNQEAGGAAGREGETSHINSVDEPAKNLLLTCVPGGVALR
jgi:hypothetical protein